MQCVHMLKDGRPANKILYGWEASQSNHLKIDNFVSITRVGFLVIIKVKYIQLIAMLRYEKLFFSVKEWI